MATTSIWRVKGWLGKVVIYVENPDKTANPQFYTQEDMTEQDGQNLSDVIRYAVNLLSAMPSIPKRHSRPTTRIVR